MPDSRTLTGDVYDNSNILALVVQCIQVAWLRILRYSHLNPANIKHKISTGLIIIQIRTSNHTGVTFVVSAISLSNFGIMEEPRFFSIASNLRRRL